MDSNELKFTMYNIERKVEKIHTAVTSYSTSEGRYNAARPSNPVT